MSHLATKLYTENNESKKTRTCVFWDRQPGVHLRKRRQVVTSRCCWIFSSHV